MSDPLQRHPLTQVLLDARSANKPLASIDQSAVPATLADAYRVQTETVQALGGIGGWKVIPTPADDKPSCSPIPASVLFENGAILARGARAEVEIGVVVGKDLSEERQYTAGDIAEALSGIHLVFEFVGSRFTDPTQMPVLATTADLQSNVAVVLGPRIQSEGLPALDKQDIALFDNGVEIQSTAGNASTEAMFQAIAWLANHARSRGLPLSAGTVVITGARLGPIEVSGPEIEARASGFDRLAATLA